MSPEEREERIKFFLILAKELPSAKQTIDNVFHIVARYDVPKHADRNFIYDCLIAYYSELENYERCAELLSFKQDLSHRKKITVRNLSRSDLSDLRMLGFKVPDQVKLKVLAAARRKES